MNKISTLIVTALAASVLVAAPASASRPILDHPSSQPWDIAQHVAYRHELLSLQRAGQA